MPLPTPRLLLLLVGAGEGSLTRSAKEVFFTKLQMEVVNTKFAVLDVDFLLLSIAYIVGCALPLLGRVLSHDNVCERHVVGKGASVHAVGWGRQGRRGRNHGA